MSTRIRNAMLVLLLSAVLIAAFAVAKVYRDEASPPTSVLASVPSDAQVVVTAHLVRIRSSPYAGLFAQEAVPNVVPGAETKCAKNLTSRIGRLALWAPADPDASLGIAAMAPASEQAVWTCARDTIAARGGKPTVVEVEGFRIISDEQLGPGAAQIAVRSPGLLLIGRPMTQSRMMDALAGRTPSATRRGGHAQTLQALSAQIPTADLTITMIVTPHLRTRIAHYLGEPTPILNEVDRLGAVAQLQTETQLLVTVWCASSDACTTLAARLETRRKRICDAMAMRAVGIARLLEQAKIDPQGNKLHVRIRASAQQVLGVVRRFKQIEQAMSAEARPPAPATRPAHSGPDEVMRPNTAPAQ